MGMMKILLIYASVVVIYIMMFNVGLAFIGIEQNVTRSDGYTDLTTPKIGVADSVSVQVERKKWYGKVIEDRTKTTTNSNLYLASFIKLPLERGDRDFKGFHYAVFIFSLFIPVIVSYIKWSVSERGYYD